MPGLDCAAKSFPPDLDFRRGNDPEPDPTTSHFQDFDGDAFANNDFLPTLTTEDQHVSFLHEKTTTGLNTEHVRLGQHVPMVVVGLTYSA